jgi:hypothetical protein
VKSLDKFSKLEMNIGWEEGKYLGKKVLVENRDERFLSIWIEN